MLYATSCALLIGVALVPASPIEQWLFDMPVKRFARLTEHRGDTPGVYPRVAAVREGLTETVLYLEMPMADRPVYHAMYMNENLNEGELNQTMGHLMHIMHIHFSKLGLLELL